MANTIRKLILKANEFQFDLQRSKAKDTEMTETQVEKMVDEMFNELNLSDRH